MPHIPYGYKIKNGKAVIDQLEALQIKKLFMAYLSGLSLNSAAKEAGIKKCHASIKNMLANERYLGDEYYSQIINKETFEKAKTEKLNRAQMLGRVWEPMLKEDSIKRFKYTVPTPDKNYEDPFKQAEYVYSLIKREEIQDGDE